MFNLTMNASKNAHRWYVKATYSPKYLTWLLPTSQQSVKKHIVGNICYEA